ncbi:MAG: DUF1049 domain-containing protein [Spirochaetes bacterium]|jgi:uncharacterized integral membrane protein|nr:DUF1049 domain-containing protein [Spirochaetota bacterium]HPA71549.1 lipopolysaccharide assembly protein LapA domain-containing protein [Spirochaetota bacterium]
MKNPKTIALIILGALALNLLFQNMHRAVVRFLFWDVSMPLIILILVALLAGFVSGYLVGKIRSRND